MKKYVLLFIAAICIVGMPSVAGAGVSNFDSIELDGYISKFGLKVTSIIMAAANYTMSASEALGNILSVTGSPSGYAITVPTPSSTTTAVLYTVRNAGADSQAVTVKISGSTGVSVATGKTAEVWCNSTDCYRKTADATH